MFYDNPKRKPKFDYKVGEIYLTTDDELPEWNTYHILVEYLTPYGFIYRQNSFQCEYVHYCEYGSELEKGLIELPPEVQLNIMVEHL